MWSPTPPQQSATRTSQSPGGQLDLRLSWGGGIMGLREGLGLGPMSQPTLAASPVTFLGEMLSGLISFILCLLVTDPVTDPAPHHGGNNGLPLLNGSVSRWKVGRGFG